jgi:glycosyltransferase involved in cell wall biosynthesis
MGAVGILEGTVHPRYLADVMGREYSRLNLRPANTPTKWKERYAAEISQADVIVTQSQFAAATYMEHGVTPSKVVALPLGVDLDLFTPRHERAQRSDPFKVLYVGRLSARKGVPHLLTAMELIDSPSMELTLIGLMDEELRDYCRERFARLGNRVRWIPGLARRDLVDHYHNADVVVLPSLCDSFGQSVLEAMACGTAVVVSDACGVPVTHGKDGFVVSAGNSEALANALETLSRSRDLVEQLGQGAAITAQNYGWEHFRKKMADMIKTAISATRTTITRQTGD